MAPLVVLVTFLVVAFALAPFFVVVVIFFVVACLANLLWKLLSNTSSETVIFTSCCDIGWLSLESITAAVFYNRNQYLDISTWSPGFRINYYHCKYPTRGQHYDKCIPNHYDLVMRSWVLEQVIFIGFQCLIRSINFVKLNGILMDFQFAYFFSRRRTG